MIRCFVVGMVRHTSGQAEPVMWAAELDGIAVTRAFEVDYTSLNRDMLVELTNYSDENAVDYLNSHYWQRMLHKPVMMHVEV